MRAKILVTDPVGGDAGFLSQLLGEFGHDVITPNERTTWQSLAPVADALIVNLASIAAATIAGLPRCRAIARLGVGTDNVDLAAARARGITVTNVPDYCVEEVSDHALTLTLASVRKLLRANGDMHAAVWSQLGYRPIRRVNQLTLGLLGFGRLAQAFALKARALGMRVIAHDPFASANEHVELVALAPLLERSDILSLHAPSTPETRHIINRAALSQMTAGAILINTSRGDLIDEAALVDALNCGILAAAALDVFETEPLAADSLLRGRADVLLTPHMAFYSEDSLRDLQRTAAEDVLTVLAGETPRNRVN